MIRAYALILLAFVSSTSAFSQRALFNGKDLTGWRIHGTERWFVEKGDLVCESGPDKQYGYLAYESDFKDLGILNILNKHLTYDQSIRTHFTGFRFFNISFFTTGTLQRERPYGLEDPWNREMVCGEG